MGSTVTVFISYAHDDEQHRATVREFAASLRAQGIDADIDSWADTDRRDWQAWATEHILSADFVLVVASKVYREMGDGLGPADRHRGVQAEAALLRDLLSEDREKWTRKVLPVILPGHRIDEIPLFLQPYNVDRYDVSSPGGVEYLLRTLTRQPEHVRPPLGPPVVLPPKSGPGAVPAGRSPQWRRLARPATVVWVADLLGRYRPQRATVELHLAPVEDGDRLRIRRLQQLADELAGTGRARDLFTHAQALDTGFSDELAWACTRDGDAGLAVHRDGQRSCWFGLPARSIGSVLDENDLTGRLADILDLLLRVDVPLPRDLAPAIGLDHAMLVYLGRLDEPSRNSVTVHGHDRVRVDAEEALAVADLRSSAHDIADELVARLVHRLRS
ncbi:toll/interleukin-1 receptor domain-containing protein [Amycolatopsis methanolica]|uniref:toll/interleukin-1 receptor domain-containing protein n=1 Tax=Amycolatopsis methanolica TaxID=1814 RepID=UPI00037ADC20|nr:toll/interleukin-1 receptor domain-containing protein [Amycolatopsis methanolica]